MTLKQRTLPIIALISFLIAAGLTVACWDMNFWPTDAEVYYMPAAKELPALKHLSQINQSLDEERIKWLHGKEFHVLAISVFQRLMGDALTLRPLLVLGIVCIFGSSILIFLIARRLWGEGIGALAWFLFASSFWPYLYILFAKHQTQGLLFFLLSLFCVLSGRGLLFFCLAGMSMAVSLFSSTVSVLYVPFMAAAFIYLKKGLLKKGLLFLAGLAVMVVYVNFPDIIGNLKSYWQYARISGEYNHFFYNQRPLAQWLPVWDLCKTRGGWWWIVEYLFLVLPIVFPLYVVSIVYLLKHFWNWKVVALVLLSFTPAILAELKGVAQYGANYFPAMFGIIMLIAYAAKIFVQDPWWPRVKRFVFMAAAVQLLWNVFVFTTDIYPCRMATTKIAQYIKQERVTTLATYPDHPLRRNFLDVLPKDVLARLSITALDTLARAQGPVLLPPVNLDNIYRGSNGNYDLYDHDLVLNNIIRQGKLDDYTTVKFKTLANSLIWSQEEEILAYRYLVLNQFPALELLFVRFLDSDRIRRDLGQFLPSPEQVSFERDGLKFIGQKHKFSLYTGTAIPVEAPRTVRAVLAQIKLIGHPQDALRAFIFKIDDQQPTWLAVEGFASIPARTEDMSVTFPYPQPLSLSRGLYSIVIYRTGQASDADYYVIDPQKVTFL